MSALLRRYNELDSKLDIYKDIALTIMDIPTVIEYSYHSIKKSQHRGIFESAVTHMVQKAFDLILDLHANERFILIDQELGISCIGSIKGVGGEVIVSIITVIDSTSPTNPYQTKTIVI